MNYIISHGPTNAQYCISVSIYIRIREREELLKAEGALEPKETGIFIVLIKGVVFARCAYYHFDVRI